MGSPRFALIGAVAAWLTVATLPAMASAAPSCAEGPQTVGDTIVGTPCDDTIHAPRGITAVFGEGGNDSLYGGRGNDSLYGGEGDDRLYGGIGDDHPRGGPGNDLLSGGFGADSLDGEAGNDFVRGDATIDVISDTGGGIDTLSYATGATPGFFNSSKAEEYPDFTEYAQFPTTVEGRGAYVNLQTGRGDNGVAPAGGGVDEEVEGTSFERVIGTAFPDFIVGTSEPETIYGGGGADVILGEGGADQLHGGAEGDSCEGDPSATIDCETSSKAVAPRAPGAIAVGLMTPPDSGPIGLYLTGSTGVDKVTASYASNPPTVTFELLSGSAGAFDTSPSSDGGCNPPGAGKVVCPLPAAPDSIVLAGLAGDDVLSAPGFPATTSVIVLGNDSADRLDGGATEDAIVDGPGGDTVNAGGGDDALPNNEGPDQLHADAGDDLFISNAVCDGDALDGGDGVDNANWANFDFAVAIDLGQQSAGLLGTGGAPDCEVGLPTELLALEDIEGTNEGDSMVGDSGPNQLLGRLGADTYHAEDGNDSILANSGDSDPVIDCGEGFDTAQIDIPTAEYEDATPTGCEAVHEREPNSFRPPDTPPNPNPPPVEPPLQIRDTTPPGTKIRHRPHRVVRTSKAKRRVAFRFTSEAGARFRCKLDRHAYAGCISPRAYHVDFGKHRFRVFAVDGAGNHDPTPASFSFRVERVSDR